MASGGALTNHYVGFSFPEYILGETGPRIDSRSRLLLHTSFNNLTPLFFCSVHNTVMHTDEMLIHVELKGLYTYSTGPEYIFFTSTSYII